jgi:GTP cyclohydrolase I
MIDIQSSESTSKFAIDRVGVTHLKYPMIFCDPETGEKHQTVGDWTLSVGLPRERRGTHMSRLVEQLHLRTQKPLDLEMLFEWAQSMEQLMGADRVEIKVDFLLFRLVHAPKTQKASFLETPVSLQVQTGVVSERTMVVDTYAKTLCPCSKAISDRGAHNQRTLIRAVLTYGGGFLLPSPLTIGSLVESCASAPIYPLLKREDEKFVTEHAYDHPGFVEDVVRSVANKLSALEGLKGFVAEVTNFESIHAHDCFARISWQSTPKDLGGESILV